MSVVSASYTHARARAHTYIVHVNTGRKREKKGEESTEVHASPPSLYRCYVTGLRRLELTTIPPPLSRRGSVNSTKLTRRSPCLRRADALDPQITRYTGIGSRFESRGQSSSSPLLPLYSARQRNIFVSASGNWMMMCRAFVASIVSISKGGWSWSIIHYRD